MKILLTHAYFLSEDPKEQEIMRPYVPLGILCLSAWLKRKGMPVTVFDTTFSTLPAFQAYLLEHTPKYVAIYTNLMTRRNVLKIIRFIRETPALKGTRIILGGPEVTHHAEALLRHGAHAIVIGEGEETLHELLLTLDTPMNPFLDTVKGIAYLNALGEVVTTPEREKIRDLDLLPLPDREAVDLNRYFQAWKSRHGESAVSISTMRGCPYTCNWCSRAVYGLSYRRRSPKKVVEEIQWIQSKYAVDTIWFVDDVFTISHKWLRGFAEELQAAGVRIRYECITRADRMNAEVVDLLVQTGCFRVWIGAESGSQRILDAMDRRVQATQVRDMILLAQAQGIQAGTFIMLGYPGEEEADIRETIRHLVAAAPAQFTITVAYPIKGTALYTEVEPHVVHQLPWEEGSDRDADFRRSHSRAWYEMAVRWVVNDVHAQLSWKRGELKKWAGHRLRSLGARWKMRRLK